MDESAKLELEHRVNLYKFLLDLCVKGILFFLAVLGVSVKLALDDKQHRKAFVVMGAAATIVMLVPILSAVIQAREWRADFLRLGKATHTKPIDMKPLWALIIGSAGFWLVFIAFWVYMYCMGS